MALAPRGAGGDGGQGRALAIKANGDHARGHIGDEHGDKVGGHPAGAALHELGVLRGEGVDAADAGAKIDAHTLGGISAQEAALLHGLAGRAHGVLGVEVAAQGLGLLHIGAGIEVPDLGGQLGLIVGGVEPGDGADAVAAVGQGVPKRIEVVAHRAHDAHAGHYYSSCHGLIPFCSGTIKTGRSGGRSLAEFPPDAEIKWKSARRRTCSFGAHRCPWTTCTCRRRCG